MTSATIFATLLALGAPDAALPKLAIFPSVVEGPEGAASAGQVFEASARGAGLRLDLAVLDYETLFLQGATSRVTEAARCGSDEACVTRVLGEAGASLGLRVVVNFALAPPLVTAELVGRSVVGEASVVRQAGERGWAETVAQAVDRLLSDRGHAPAGLVQIETEPPGLEVRVLERPESAPSAGSSWRLPPGRYTVRARAADGREATQTVVVGAHQRADLFLRLPGGAAAAANDDGSIFSTWWFWAGVGVVAAGAATAAVVATDPFGGDPAPACLCITTPSGPCGACP